MMISPYSSLPVAAYVQSVETAPCYVLEEPIRAEVRDQYLSEQLSVAQRAAFEAGHILMKYWKSGVAVELKEGHRGDISPVTQADLEANELICKALVQCFPEFGLLTEEKIDDPKVLEAISRWRDAEYTWMIDPLDGTKNFVNDSPEFGIHIGLCHNGIPVLGVNYFPALKVMYWAVEGQGAYKVLEDGTTTRLHVDRSETELKAVRSPNDSIFSDQVIEQMAGHKDFPRVGGAGLKICLIAEGVANLFVSKGTKGGSLWDYCSGQIVLQEAGGILTDRFGNPIDYRGITDVVNGSIISGSDSIYKQALEISRSID